MNEFEALNATVVSISVDSVEQQKKLSDSHGFDFRMLSDPDLTAIDAWGLRHVDGGPFGDIARPAVFIIDEDGGVAWRGLTDNWRIRVRPETILEQLAR